MKNNNVETLLGTNEKETKRMNKGLRSLLSGVSLAIVGSLCVGLVLYVENTTKDQIAENQKNSIDARVLALLPDEAKDKGSQITCYQIKKGKYITQNNLSNCFIRRLMALERACVDLISRSSKYFVKT